LSKQKVTESSIGDWESSFERFDRYRITLNLTWNEVAERLGVSVGMLMMVKSGKRSPSKKVLHALSVLEVEAKLRPTTTEEDLMIEEEIKRFLFQTTGARGTAEEIAENRYLFLIAMVKVAAEELRRLPPMRVHRK
jgi:transcriptional regulator with XRE-family HTH domain